jgi:hypothetical protein
VTSIDIRDPVSIPCGTRVLALEPGGRITVSGAGGAEQTVVAPDLALSNQVELWCRSGRAYLVGLKAKAVWFTIPSQGVLTEVLQLDRLDLRGHYDPGGLHRVGFRELQDGDLLIVHELGLARVGPDGSVQWQQVHDDLTARLDRLDEGIAWFFGESGLFGFRLSDGGPVATP